MLSYKVKPSEILKKYIDSYFVVESESLSEFSESQRVYPIGSIVLLFHFHSPYLFQKRDNPIDLEPRSVICGQQTTYYDLTPSGKTGMVFVLFKPYGAGMFFNIPMKEINNQNIAFENIVKNEAYVVEDKIQNASTNKERVSIIEKYLTGKLMNNYKNHDQIIKVFDEIYQKEGQVSIKNMADVACLSVKQLERKFSALVGLNPKQFLRTIRFQNVLKIKREKSFLDNTSVAMVCGYFDQSHFIHDFKTITGLTPRNFFNKNKLV